jgi:CHRD domain
MKRKLALLVAFCTLLVLVGAGIGNAASATYRLAATLTAGQMPKQAVASPHASARFAATLIRTNRLNTFSWHLTYSGLSSAPTVALIRLPAGSGHGEVVVQLCKGSRCSQGLGRPIRLPAVVAKALATRAGYVEVGTQKNPRGEVRGRLTR